MDVFIGVDVAKAVHWACAMDRNARVLFRHAVHNDPAAIGALIGEIEALEARAAWTAVDMLGGAVRLVCAMFAEAGLPLVHRPGLAVNRARQGIRGGEGKSDPKDAAVIAELARTRPDLRAVEPPDPQGAKIRLLVSRRRARVTERPRRVARLRDLLSGLFPALERRIDPTTRTGLVSLSHYAAPEDICAAGAQRIVRRPTRAATGLRGLEALAEDAVRAAQAQTVAIPGARLRAEIVADIAREAQAAAAGLAPVLRQSGKIRVLRRAAGGDKALKRAFHRAAFTSFGRPDSRAFYDRKRAEGKRHQQAVVALARRRVNVLWAVPRNREPFRENFKLAA